EENWLGRVWQNARAFFELRGAPALAHCGPGAFDLLDVRPEPGTRRRQAASVLLHAVVIGALLMVGKQVVRIPAKPPGIFVDGGIGKYWRPEVSVRADKPGGKEGSGGKDGLLPPTAGDYARLSRMVLLHPRVPDQQEHLLPVEPTVFEANANDSRHVLQIGLPNMKERNDSNGPGRNDGIGNNGPGNTMGKADKKGVGESNEDGMPRRGAYRLKCLYCPDPEYTEEARKAKMQGSVTLEVLVRADGRVGRVRIVKGIGLGLDERAVDAVRSWRFEPARD